MNEITAFHLTIKVSVIYLSLVYCAYFQSYKMCNYMTVSYKKLWKLLIDKDLMKKDLQQKAGISWATMTKMSKGEVVSTEVLMKV